MNTRSLSILVLTFVLGTVLVVGWYLEGERTAAAAARAADAEVPTEHVWRSYPGTVSTGRSQRNWGGSTSSLGGSRSRRGRMPSLAPAMPATPAASTGAVEVTETTLHRPHLGG